jgi:hypothetical protein
LDDFFTNYSGHPGAHRSGRSSRSKTVPLSPGRNTSFTITIYFALQKVWLIKCVFSMHVHQLTGAYICTSNTLVNLCLCICITINCMYVLIYVCTYVTPKN